MISVVLRDSLATAVQRLTAKQVGSPRLNAEILLMFVLGCDRAYFFAHPERELTAEELSRYEELIGQRGNGIPAQYITGHQEFWGLDFIVTPAVLIPRPETEHLIEAVLELARTGGLHPPGQPRAAAPTRPSREPGVALATRVVDVGTGSGCIAVVLAKELPGAQIHAIDISAPALEVARANAARHQVEGRIDFRQGDLLEGFEPASLDFVVSNPPYVGDSEEDHVQLEVRKFEPRNAVFAGHTGLEIIKRLAPQAERTLQSGGWLVMEISGTIAEGVKGILKGWDGVTISNDLQGIPRVVTARRR